MFLVGRLGIDSIKKIKLLDRTELEISHGYNVWEKNLLVTFHPVSLEIESAAQQMENLLAALAELDDNQLIFTFPNADTDDRMFIKMVNKFVKHYNNAQAFTSLG